MRFLCIIRVNKTLGTGFCPGACAPYPISVGVRGSWWEPSTTNPRRFATSRNKSTAIVAGSPSEVGDSASIRVVLTSTTRSAGMEVHPSVSRSSDAANSWKTRTFILPPNEKGQRLEPAADDVRFVSERIGWLRFAAPSGSLLLLYLTKQTSPEKSDFFISSS